MESRIRNAIEFLKDGLPFRVGDLYFGIDGNNRLNVTGVSRSTDLKNVTKRMALDELQEIMLLFDKMVSVSYEFKSFVDGKLIVFNLDLDYGMGDIRICSYDDGVVNWMADIKK